MIVAGVVFAVWWWASLVNSFAVVARADDPADALAAPSVGGGEHAYDSRIGNTDVPDS